MNYCNAALIALLALYHRNAFVQLRARSVAGSCSVDVGEDGLTRLAFSGLAEGVARAEGDHESDTHTQQFAEHQHCRIYHAATRWFV